MNVATMPEPALLVVRLPIVLDTGVSKHHVDQTGRLNLRGRLRGLLLAVFEVGHVLMSTQGLFELIFLTVKPVIKLLPIVAAEPLFLDHHVLFIREDLRVWLNRVDEGTETKGQIEVKRCRDAVVGV